MIRQLEIPAAWVKDGYLGPLPGMLGYEQPPADVREIQGTVAFVFPEIEDQAESIFAVPGVLGWLRMLHTEIPHVTYFLFPHPRAAALQGLLLSGVDDEAAASAIAEGRIPIDASQAYLTDRMTACAIFATEMGDDWERIVAEFLAPPDDQVSQQVLDAVSLRL
jgi:hypothetical protein